MNREERDRFISENIGLVHSCANRFRGRGMEYDDLFQAGCLGLVKAVDAFDSSRGVRFSTYAVPVILGLFALKGVLVVLPYSLLTTVTGLVFGFLPALVINIFGTALCVTIPYLTGKSAKREDVMEKVRSNRLLAKFYTGKESDLFPLCFSLRLAGVQSEMLSIFFGNIGMPYLPYLAASILGKLSLTVCYTILGSTLSASELSPVAMIFFGLDTVMLVISLLVFRKKRKAHEKEEDGAEGEESEEGTLAAVEVLPAEEEKVTADEIR